MGNNVYNCVKIRLLKLSKFYTSALEPNLMAFSGIVPRINSLMLMEETLKLGRSAKVHN